MNSICKKYQESECFRYTVNILFAFTYFLFFLFQIFSIFLFQKYEINKKENTQKKELGFILFFSTPSLWPNGVLSNSSMFAIRAL